jgi:predicted metal-dependent hydrolase
MPEQDLAIDYQIRYSRRRTLAVYVYPDRRVEVRAPQGCPDALIQRFLRERAEWIRDKQRAFAEASPRPQASYEEGDPQPFLGQLYPLELASARPHGVWLAAGRLLVRGRPEQVPRLLDAWYRRQAKTVLAERLAHCREAMAGLRLPPSGLRLRQMRSRWGSCSSRGDVTLNIDLVRYPLRLIDYVVVHELCHLREFHHGPAFYRLMDAVMPDWADRKRELRQSAAAMPPWPGVG